MDGAWLLLVPVKSAADLQLLQTNSDSTRNEQVKTGVCLINFDGSSANVTLFSSRKIFVLKSFWLAVNLFRDDIGPTYQSSDDSKGGPGWAMAPPEFWLAPCLPTPVFS